MMGSRWASMGDLRRHSGAENHPMDLAWACALRDECRAHHVAFFMKQLGTVYAQQQHLCNGKGEDPAEFPNDLRIWKFPGRMIA